MTNSRPDARPTIPLVPDLIDVRLHHDLTASRANSDIFGGWGVRLPSIW